jgi:hypothetical protein
MKIRCDYYLVLCSTIGDGNSGAEIFCDRPRGHKGKHSGFATRESVDGDFAHDDIRIWWKG